MTTPSGPQDPFGSSDNPYGQQPPSYGQQPPSYGQQPPAYGQGAYPSYPQAGGGYGGGYGAGGYGSGGYNAGPPPQNYLVWAILSTILCCLPLGVASIVFSTQVNSKWAQGDVAGANESARKAKLFAIWSAVVGLIGAVVYIIGMVAWGWSASTSFSTSY